jgi:hypothetical protein
MSVCSCKNESRMRECVSHRCRRTTARKPSCRRVAAICRAQQTTHPTDRSDTNTQTMVASVQRSHLPSYARTKSASQAAHVTPVCPTRRSQGVLHPPKQALMVSHSYRCLSVWPQKPRRGTATPAVEQSTQLITAAHVSHSDVLVETATADSEPSLCTHLSPLGFTDVLNAPVAHTHCVSSLDAVCNLGHDRQKSPLALNTVSDISEQL